MSDILFRYLLAARRERRSRSLWHRLVHADVPWLEAGVEQLVETAAARIVVTSQHERRTLLTVRVPLQDPRPSKFYAAAVPNRPVAGRFFRQRSERFPLRDTFEIAPCRGCDGLARTPCEGCSGRSTVACSECDGSGGFTPLFRCIECEGTGIETCGACSGAGWSTCLACLGRGEEASWKEEVYRWRIERRIAQELPLPRLPGAVRRSLDEWFELDPDLVPGAEAGAAVEHLGFATQEALAVAARAEGHCRRLVDEAGRSKDRYLFHRTDLSLTPFGYTVMRLAGRASTFWLVGRGEKAREVMPRDRLDRRKCLGWLGLGLLLLAGLGLAGVWPVGWAPAHGLASLLLDGLLAVLAVAGGVLAFLGARRIFRRGKPVQAIGLIAPAGSTAYLTCLAYLGSYLRRLRVLDRAYDLQAARIRGRKRPQRQSGSLGIELPDGRKVRLTEVARVDRLSAAEIRRMVRALDGLVILEAPGRTAEELRATIVALAETPPRIGSLPIDEGAGLDAPGAALPLEAIRRSFVEDLGGDVDWPALFDRMWGPLGEILEPSTGRTVTETPAGPPADRTSRASLSPPGSDSSEATPVPADPG